MHEVAMTTLSGQKYGLGSICLNVISHMKMRHGPRVKVSNVPGTFSGTDNFSLNFKGELVGGKSKLKPDQMALVKLWVLQNQDALQQIWDNESLMSDDHKAMLKKVKLFLRCSVGRSRGD